MDQVRNTVLTSNTTENGLVFLTTNTNGICTNTKLDELHAVLHMHRVDAAVISETHLGLVSPTALTPS